MMYLDCDNDIYWEGIRLNNHRFPSAWKPPHDWYRTAYFEHYDYTSVLLPEEYMK